MLDTNCRKFVQPFIAFGAKFFMKLGMNANQVTIIALILGVTSGVLTYLGMPILALSILWLSGYLDAVDGTLAREKGSTPFGTVMDITFDRIVEIALIIGLAFRAPEQVYLLLFLACSIIVTMTIFLTTGTMADKVSEKSFYYQSGLAERTEGFIMFSLMIVFSSYQAPLTIIFTGMILFTSVQRFTEAKKLLDR